MRWIAAWTGSIEIGAAREHLNQVDGQTPETAIVPRRTRTSRKDRIWYPRSPVTTAGVTDTGRPYRTRLQVRLRGASSAFKNPRKCDYKSWGLMHLPISGSDVQHLDLYR